MDSASISIGVFTLFDSDSDVDAVCDKGDLVPFESQTCGWGGCSLIGLAS